jgi:hypothetical protein
MIYTLIEEEKPKDRGTIASRGNVWRGTTGESVYEWLAWMEKHPGSNGGYDHCWQSMWGQRWL